MAGSQGNPASPTTDVDAALSPELRRQLRHIACVNGFVKIQLAVLWPLICWCNMKVGGWVLRSSSMMHRKSQSCCEIQLGCSDSIIFSLFVSRAGFMQLVKTSVYYRHPKFTTCAHTSRHRWISRQLIRKALTSKIGVRYFASAVLLNQQLSCGSFAISARNTSANSRNLVSPIPLSSENSSGVVGRRYAIDSSVRSENIT